MHLLLLQCKDLLLLKNPKYFYFVWQVGARGVVQNKNKKISDAEKDKLSTTLLFMNWISNIDDGLFKTVTMQ